MAQLAGSEETESLRIELAEIGRSLRSSFRRHASSFRSSTSALSAAKDDNVDAEIALHWADIDRLPIFERLRSSLFDDNQDGSKVDGPGKGVIDVTELGAIDRLFIENLIKNIENDNLRLLQKPRKRIDKSAVKLTVKWLKDIK